MDLIIGSHVSFTKSDGLIGSVKEALSYQSNTFMIYTGAPQNTSRSAIDQNNVLEAKKMMIENGIDINNVVVHAPYIINLANPKGDNFAVDFLKQELVRCFELGINKLVLHPGSFVDRTREDGINNIINGLNEVLEIDNNVLICLETMAGKGTEIGSTIDEIQQIFQGVKKNNRLRICLDSCHLNDAGYDVNDFDAILDEIETKVGKNLIACIHINDSKNLFASHKDRHDNIGTGSIGFDNLISIIYNERLKNVPKILETPYIGNSDDDKSRIYPPYRFEIEMIRKKVYNQNLLEDIRKYYK